MQSPGPNISLMTNDTIVNTTETTSPDSCVVFKSFVGSAPIPVPCHYLDFFYESYDILSDIYGFHDLYTTAYMRNLEIIQDFFGVSFAVLLCGVLGIPTNIIIIVVFSRLGLLADSCTPILLTLAVADTFFCIKTLCYFLLRIGQRLLPPSTTRSNHAFLFIFESSTNVTIQFICWCVAFLSLERMISVTFPFHVKMIFTPRRSWIIIGIIFVLTFILQLDSTIGSKLVLDRTDDDESLYLRTSFFEILPEEIGKWSSLLNESVLRTLSILCVIVFNIVIMVKVNRSKNNMMKSKIPKTSTSTKAMTQTDKNEVGQKMNKKSNPGNKEMKLTRLVTATSILFVLCYIPGSAWNIAYYVYGESKMTDSNALLVYINHVQPAMEGFNSSLNFLFYYGLSSKFKSEVRNLFLCLKHRK